MACPTTSPSSPRRRSSSPRSGCKGRGEPDAVKKLSLISVLASQGVLIALALLILFGWLRYDNFLGLFNISTVLRYNSMFALVALGMCFVIMTGGIDLSVGGTAALGSVVSALLSPYGLWAGLFGGWRLALLSDY